MANSDQDIERLITGAQRGDVNCFDGLIDAFAGRLYGYFYRLTANRTEAEDLLQEAFLRLVQAIEHYDHRSRFESFLFRIAGNLYRDRLRKFRRVGRSVSLAESGLEEGTNQEATADAHHDEGPSAGLELAETIERVQVALAQLPAGEQQVIALRHFADLSFKDIAQMADIPIGTALARAHRGLKKLKDLLGHE